MAEFSGRGKIPLRSFGPLDDPHRSLHLNAFKAPACAECNESLSDFENCAKSAFGALHRGRCSRDDIGTILDWMDKFRTIYWLYRLAINKRHHNITPLFSAFDRIDAHDRYVSIFRMPSEFEMGVSIFSGSERGFLYLPSVIGIAVRNIVVISFSGGGVMLRHFGAAKWPEHRQRIGEPTKLIMNHGFTMKPILDLVRIDGLQSFTFSSRGTIPPPTASLVVQTGGRMTVPSGCERFHVPKARTSRNVAFGLASLSVLELQMRAFLDYDQYELPLSEIGIISALRREISDMINGDLQKINSQSFVQYRRKFPEI